MMVARNVTATLALLFQLALVGCGEETPAPTAALLPAVAVQVETLTLSTVPFQIEVAGTVRAVDQAEIAPRISGAVLELPVQTGSHVKKGELLVRLDAAEITAQLHRAEAIRAQAQRNLDREARLFELNASTAETVRTLQEAVAISEATYRETKAMLAYTAIRAPFTGRVTEKLVEVGDLALPGRVLLKLESGTALEVEVPIPETLGHDLALGDLLQVKIAAAALTADCAITEIAPTVDPKSRTTRVKLALPADHALRSGQFARVALSGDNATTLIIAKSALQRREQMEQVFVVDQNVARLRLVRVGADYGDRIEILSGLQAGEQVVVNAEKSLLDRQPVLLSTGQTK